MYPLTRVVNGQTEHARMDLVFNLHGSITHLDVSIVAPFSCSPWFLLPAQNQDIWPRAEKTKFDRYPHINLVPLILETTGRPGPHARKFMNYFLRDADNQSLAIRDTWSTIQSVLPQCHLQNNNLRKPLRDSWGLLSHSVDLIGMVLVVAGTGPPGTHTAFVSQACCS